MMKEMYNNYKKDLKNKNNILLVISVIFILGLIFGSLAWVVVAMIVNATILIPFYSKAFGFSAVVEMCRSIFPKITETNFMVFYILGSILPFNLMLSFIVSIVTFLVYKRISALFKKDFIH